jgi:hypothetical protein
MAAAGGGLASELDEQKYTHWWSRFKEDEVMATLEIKDMENVSIVPGEKLPFALVQKLGLPEDTTWYDQSA